MGEVDVTEYRLGELEKAVASLRDTTVQRDVFDLRMQAVDLKLNNITTGLDDIKTGLNTKSNWRSGLTQMTLASLGSGAVLALVTYLTQR